MTSVMRRPHSTHPGDFGHGELPRTAGRPRTAAETQQTGNGTAGNGSGNTLDLSSPSALGMFGSDSSRTFHLPPSSHDSNTNTASGSGSSSNMIRQLPATSREVHGPTVTATDQSFSLDPGQGPSGTVRTIFDDPGILAMASQSHTPYASALDLGFDPSHPSFLSALPPQDLPQSVSQTISDLDIASSAMLQFPELPASLLDQAPEYEYSVHTQSNVFDAAQDYDGSGEDEAARVFGLDNYDSSISSQGREDLSAGAIQDVFPQGSLPVKSGDYSQDGMRSEAGRDLRSSSMSIPSHTGFGSGDSVSAFPEQGSLYRQGSFDASGHDDGESKHTSTVNSSPSTLFSYQQAHARDDERHMPSNRLEQGPLVPSQGAGANSFGGRGRIASWAGDTPFVNDWTSGSQIQGMPMATGAHRSGYPAHDMGSRFMAQARPDMLHAMNSAMESSMEGDGVAKCPYPNCSKTFAKNRSYNLKAHLRSHSQLKPYQCSHCPRAFSRKHDLERHSRVHSGDKPYLCEACGKGFPRSDALRRHWRVEKECGDKAVEIEAKQPLPSLPPGVNVPSASVQGPMPGVIHVGPAVTTAVSSSGMPSSMSVGSGLNAYGQLQHHQVQLQQHQPQAYGRSPQQHSAPYGSQQSFEQQQQQQGHWSSSPALMGAVGSNASQYPFPPHSQTQHDPRQERGDR